MKKKLPILSAIVSFLLYYFGSFILVSILFAFIDLKFEMMPLVTMLISTAVGCYGMKWAYKKTKNKMKEI